MARSRTTFLLALALAWAQAFPPASAGQEGGSAQGQDAQPGGGSGGPPQGQDGGQGGNKDFPGMPEGWHPPMALPPPAGAAAGAAGAAVGAAGVAAGAAGLGPAVESIAAAVAAFIAGQAGQAGAPIDPGQAGAEDFGTSGTWMGDLDPADGPLSPEDLRALIEEANREDFAGLRDAPGISLRGGTEVDVGSARVDDPVPGRAYNPFAPPPGTAFAGGPEGFIQAVTKTTLAMTDQPYVERARGAGETTVAQMAEAGKRAEEGIRPGGPGAGFTTLLERLGSMAKQFGGEGPIDGVGARGQMMYEGGGPERAAVEVDEGVTAFRTKVVVPAGSCPPDGC